jgi:arginine repressor
MQKTSNPVRKLIALSLALSTIQLTLVNESIADDETQAQILNQLEDQSFMMRQNQMNRDLDEMRAKRESDNREIENNYRAYKRNQRQENDIQERVDLLNQGIDPSILDR